MKIEVVWKIRGRFGDSGTLPLTLLLRSGAEFEEVQRGGGTFSLSLLGEFLRGGVGGGLDGLGKAFTRVPRGAEMVYERLWRRMRMGLGERLGSMSICVPDRVRGCYFIRLLCQPINTGAPRSRIGHCWWHEHDSSLLNAAIRVCVCAWM